MMTLHEIENAIVILPPDDLSRLRAWFIQSDAEAWDQQIEEDIRAGRLDSLAEEALQDLREGRTTEL